MPNIAIIGSGLIGETHAHCLAELGTPPMLFVDTNYTRAEGLAALYSVKATDNPMAAIEAPGIDAVYICTYHDTHAPLAIAAAKAGKHIFLEKPMAITERDCRAIVEAVTESSVLCMTGFKLHYCSLARKAKTLMKNPQVLSAQVMDKRWPDDSWANDPIRGGGNVLSQGCHAVEMLCYVAGSKPIRIFAEGGNLRHPKLGTQFVDTMAATLSFENGAVATLLIGDAGETPHDGKFSFQAMNGTQSFHLYNRLTALSYFDGEQEQIFSAEEDGFIEENREFLSAIADGRPAETNEINGFRAEMILLRGIEAIRTGKPQSLIDLP
ncbi:MAG: Gfo/Idh/MocA family protein [Candidatus Kapaibacterium sp.]